MGFSGFGPGSPDCPSNPTMNMQKVPDPNDCTRYSKCSTYFSVRLSCPIGKHFSKTELECVDYCTAGCDPEYSCPNEHDPDEPTSQNGKCKCDKTNN